MKPTAGRTARCTLQSCHVYDRGAFHLDAAFQCERGERCPVLHPPPPLPIWRRPWFRKAVGTALGVSVLMGAFLGYRGVEEAKKPRIITLAATTNAGAGEHWEAYVEAGGEDPLVYQWYRGLRGETSVPLDRGTSSRYEIPSLTERAMLWVRVQNKHGRVDSEQLTVEPRIVVQVDYERELFELSREARAILEQSDSVKIIDTQLHAAYAALEPAERDRYLNIREMAGRKRGEAAVAFVAKLKYLQTLDRKLISQMLAKAGGLFSGIEAERRAKTLSLMKKHWNALSQGEAVSEENVLKDAENFLPL